MKVIPKCDHSSVTVELYFSVALFITLSSMVLTLSLLLKSLSDYPIESYFAAPVVPFIALY